MFLAKLDDWLITNVFEPIAWHTEYRFGLSCFNIARPVLWFAFAAYFGSIGGVIPFQQNNMHLLVILLIVILIVTHTNYMVWVRSINTLEQETRRAKGVNWMRGMWPLRWTRILTCPLLLIAILWLFGDTHMWSSFFLTGTMFFLTFYFASCNTLPPGWKPPVRASKLVTQTASMHS